MACNARVASGADEETSVEDTLADMELIDLTQNHRMYSSFHYISNSAHRVWCSETNGGGHECRPFDLPVCFVHGPSGSGKTFFARNLVAERLYQGEYNRTRNVTLYLCPKRANVKFVYNDEGDGTNSKRLNDEAATELFDWIKRALRTRNIEIRHKLNMHVCIIIDNVSAQDIQCFRDWGILNALCSEANKFAESAVVAICSTGLTRYDRKYKSGVYTFRMEPWDEEDLQEVLPSFRAELGLQIMDSKGKTRLAKALWAHPKLGALATNAYMAKSMVKAFASIWSMFYRDPWNSKRDDIASHVVPRVLQDYLDKYGISRLSPKHQRRIAASVFRVQGKEGIEEVPALVGLTESEIVIAESFLHYNIIDNGDWFKVSVTPGQELVLFAMAGIPITLIARWNTEEQLAAFYVVRKAMLQCMEQFAACMENSKDNNADCCLEKLDDSLENIRLYSLQKHVETDHQSTYRYVPMVDVGAITMNGNGAPFADIVAPYTLIQCWRRSSQLPLKVDLEEELQKCGLLKEDCDARVLQGLLALWQLRANSLDQIIWQPEATTTNTVSLLPSSNFIRYTVIEGESGIEITVGDGNSIGLPNLDGTSITFLLSTDASAVELYLAPRPNRVQPRPVVHITRANLGEDMEVNIDSLSDGERFDWTQFVSEKLREEVRIKFLFTSKED